MDEILTYLALREDGRSSFLDLHTPHSGEDATLHARGLLKDHLSCARVEIWSESACVAVVERAPAR